ncbi:MAG: DHH family phosphoesterase [Halanaerobiales bacterium]
MSLKNIAKKLETEDNYIILGHIDPDADCIGSMVALNYILAKLNKKSHPVFSQDPPENLKFLFAGKNENLNYSLLADFEPSALNWSFYNIICLDCGDRDRLGEGKNLLANNYSINIDHHIDNTRFGDINYVNPDMAATGQIIYNLGKILQDQIDVFPGTAIAAAIISDTGSFRYQNTDPDVFRLIADLMDNEVDIYRVNRKLYSQNSYASLKLKGQALTTLELDDSGKIAWLYIDQKMLAETKTGPEAASGLVNYARDIQGVEIGICFTAINDEEIKVSLRSSENCPVHKIAAIFNGGGHPRAAGCTINSSMNQAIASILEEVKKFV